MVNKVKNNLETKLWGFKTFNKLFLILKVMNNQYCT